MVILFSFDTQQSFVDYWRLLSELIHLNLLYHCSTFSKAMRDSKFILVVDFGEKAFLDYRKMKNKISSPKTSVSKIFSNEGTRQLNQLGETKV